MRTFKDFYTEKVVIGLIEHIDVEGVGKIPAKLDSGNGAYNVLHGDDIQEQGSKVIFKTVNNKRIIKDVVNHITINVGAGNTESRPVVKFNIRVGKQQFTDVLFSIGNRESNIFKILVGKDFIENHLDALIDVGQENIADQNIEVDYNL